jgi:hypothetical protein
MIEAHAVQFLPVAALGATQREMFAATGAISAVGYTVSEAARTAMLAL